MSSPTPTSTETPQQQRMRADVALVRKNLDRIERNARKLKWAKERPWKPSTHVWAEGFVAIVDLHDLSVTLGKKATREVIRLADRLQCGAVSFITGQGNNAIGPGEMKLAISSQLKDACDQRPQWSYRPDGPGRFMLVVDPQKAAPEVLSSLPRGFWIIIAAFAAAFLFALFRNVLF